MQHGRTLAVIAPSHDRMTDQKAYDNGKRPDHGEQSESDSEAKMTKEREDRQREICRLLSDSSLPLRGEDLARRLDVTRQVVVHEIALLRASGVDIVATPRGYYIDQRIGSLNRDVLAVRHSPEQTATELYILVDHGIVVDNVVVEHPLYGELSGSLRISSRMDVEEFLAQVASSRAALLSELTDGYHTHTVEFRERQHLDRGVKALRKQGVSVFP